MFIKCRHDVQIGSPCKLLWSAFTSSRIKFTLKMVSYFGEVVFPSSRAFWDEDDEDGPPESTGNKPELLVRWLKDMPSSQKQLIVVEGDMLIDFVKQCLCSEAEEVCIVEDDNQKKIGTMYQINEHLYLCIILQRFDMKHAGTFIEKISDILLKCENIISLTCRHVSAYKGTNVPSTPSFLRMLNTHKGERYCKLQAKFLEQPNIVFGVAAGVLSFAHFMEVPSTLYVLYTDSFVLDSVSAEPLLQLFRTFDCTLHDVTFIGKDFFNKGNLYI